METIAHRIFGYLLPHRTRIALAFVFLLSIQVVQLLKPWPLKITIDSILGGGGPTSGFWGGLSMETGLLLVCAALVLIYFSLGGLVLLSNYTTLRIGNTIMNDFRGDLYSHIQRLSLVFHARQHVGDILYRITTDTSAIQVIIIRGIFPLLSAFLLLGGIFAVMFTIDPALSLVIVGICPALLISVATLNRKITTAAVTVREKESTVFSLVNTSLSAIRIVQAFTGEASEHRKFMHASRESLDAGLRLNLVETAHAWVVNTLIAIGTAFVIWVGARHVLSGLLTIGDMVVFISYVTALYGPVNSITQSWGLLHEAKAGLDRVFQILNVDHDLPDGHRIFPAKGTPCDISFQGVVFGYPQDPLILKNINLHIRAGEKVAIVGASGAGKSTLISLIPRFCDPCTGSVLLDGEDIRTYRLDSLRRQIAMVLQMPVVFPLSISENIAYGCPDARQPEIVSAARLACIHDFIERLPDGYGTLIGEGGYALSEGEKQRITIARAILRDAPILILDEPTSSVDVKTEERIMESLLEPASSKTVIVITHRLSAVRHADRIVVIEAGEIIEEGTFDGLHAASPHIAAALKTVGSDIVSPGRGE